MQGRGHFHRIFAEALNDRIREAKIHSNVTDRDIMIFKGWNVGDELSWKIENVSNANIPARVFESAQDYYRQNIKYMPPNWLREGRLPTEGEIRWYVSDERQEVKRVRKFLSI